MTPKQTFRDAVLVVFLSGKRIVFANKVKQVGAAKAVKYKR